MGGLEIRHMLVIHTARKRDNPPSNKHEDLFTCVPIPCPVGLEWGQGDSKGDIQDAEYGG